MHRFYLIIILATVVLILTLIPIYPASAQFVTGGEPSVKDDLGNDDGGIPIFSPNNDGVQEKVVITFRPSSDKGDFLVIVDTHGPGGLGKADGSFHNLLPVTSSDDWAFLGTITTTDVKRVEWDGKDRNTTTAKFAEDGTYNILVELDNVADGKVDRTAAGYASKTLTVKIDTVKPIVAVSTEPFSPNGDGQKDTGTISFGLSEDLFQDAKIEFDNPIPELLSVAPKIVGDGKVKGPHTSTWDGTDSTGKTVSEGLYALKVSATDYGGNTGTATTSIRVDFTAPKVISTSPKEGATNNSNLEIALITATLDDGANGSNFNFTKTPPTIKLLNASNVEVAGSQSLDETSKTLTWKLTKPLISTADNGSYTISVKATDQAGNTLSGGETKVVFIYDTQAPKINSVVSATTTLKVGDSNISLPATATITITLSDLGGSGVNFGTTSVQLLAPPANTAYPLRKTTDGVNSITTDYESLQQQGLYTLRISAVDKATNSTGNIDYQFKYDIDPPNITSVSAGTANVDINSSLSFVSSQLDRISAVLQDVNNLTELDLTKSTVRLKDSTGTIVAGAQENNGTNSIIWKLNSTLPKDGSKDGAYTITVEAYDKVSNKTTKEFKINYDTKAPEAKELSPQDKSVLKAPISAATITITDGTGSGISGVDFSKSSLKLLNPSGSAVSSQQSNNASDSISISFAAISQTGKYSLEATLIDKAGNSVVKQFSFEYTVEPPKVVAITPPNKSKVNKLTEVKSTLQDNSGLGIDFSSTTIKLTGPTPTNQQIDGTISNNGKDEMKLTLVSPLLTDGADDGSYTVQVAPKDKSGASGLQAQSIFTYDTQRPSLSSLTVGSNSIDLTLTSTTTFIGGGGSVDKVSAILQDKENRSEIDLNKSTIRLKDSKGIVVAGAQEDNTTNSITWRLNPALTKDGSKDGAYTVEVVAFDKASNSLTSQYNIIYDSKIPVVDSTIPASGSTISSSLSQISIKLSDGQGSGVNLSATNIKLLSPSSQAISFTKSDNGTDTLFLSFEALKTDGIYAIEITPQDKAGNVSGSATRVEFVYLIKAAKTISVIPADLSFVKQISQVEADLIGVSTGVDLDKSTVKIKDKSGKEISGDQRNDGVSKIRMELNPPLAADGSADGLYSVEIAVVDKSGGSTKQTSSFTYDSKPPEIMSTTPADKSSIKGSLSSASITVGDSQGSGIDFSKSTLRLLSPSNQAVSAQPSNNGLDKLTLSFSPLIVSGRYIIEANLTDKAGNSTSKQYTFDYAVDAIAIVSATPADNSKVNQLDQIKITLQTGAGIDFSATTLKLLNPKNEGIAGILSNNGKDEITLTLANPLPKDGSADGNYTFEITASDQAGRKETKKFIAIYDTQPPALVSTLPASGSTVTQALKQIIITLTDGTSSGVSGVDFAATIFKFNSPTSQAISISKNDNGKDTVVLDFAPLKTDGTVDGIYTLEITPQDKAKNIAPTRKIEFVYLTKPSEIISTTPDDRAIVNQVSSVESDLKNLASTTDFDKSSISLKDSKGSPLKGRQVVEGSKIKLELERPLPTDGSADGTYTLEISIVDKSGKITSQTNSFLYDSLPPSIVDSNPKDKATIKNDISSITLSIADGAGSGLDFSASTVKLSIGTQTVSTQQSNDGAGKITLSFSELPQTGKYTIDLALVDKAKNRFNRQLSFDYTIDPPKVITVSPENRGKVKSITSISATLQDNSAKGLDFSSSGSSIKLLGPNNKEIDGSVSNDGKSEMKLAILTPFATDGSDDGAYTIQITPKDNSGTQGLQRQFTFTYDSQAPDVVSVTFVDLTSLLTNVSQEILKIEANLSDGSGTGVDVKKSSIRFKDKDGKIVEGKQTDDDKTKIRWELNQPLPKDGSVDGRYAIELMAFDQTGNSETNRYEILYDTKIPTIVSTLPSTASSVKPPFNQLSVKLSDGNGSGVDLSGINVQLIGPKGAIGSNKAANGTDTIFLTFDTLKTDGSDDGVYRIEATPKDRAGNAATSALKFEFSYTTENPELTSTVPAELSFVSQLSSISALLGDKSGKGIDLEKSTIRLKAPDGKEVEGRQTDDKSKTINWLLSRPLPTNGSIDGEYVIAAKVVDKASNVAEYQKRFSYDTSIPKITKITPEDAATITGSLNEISVILNDGKGSGVNLSGTTITLKNPTLANILGNKSDNGIDTLKFSFRDLTDSGSYIVEITPKDMAGNVSTHPIQSRFSIVSKPPVVTSVTVIEKDFVNNLDEIVATFEDRSGVGLNLNATLIKVISPKGEIEGDISIIGKNSVRWKPIVLLKRDGSDDGNYSITVTPVDNAGRSGQARQRTVVYDTQVPELVSASPVNINLPLTYSGSQISLVEAQLKDFGPSDIEISDQQIRLLSANGSVISGLQSDNGKDKISWQLTKPLSTDGKADGIYFVLVTTADKSGNKKEYRYRLIYDTQAPQVVKVTPPDKEAISGDLTSIVIQLKDAGEGQVDFDLSKIKLLDPNNKTITGSSSNNGEDQITLKFSSLDTDGTYNLEITAVDKAGNGLNNPTKTSFLFSTGLPIVISTTPLTIPSDKAYENKRLTRVEAKLQETNNGGINLTPTGSEIRLKDPNGNVVAGNLTNNGVDTIIWNLARPLEPDGSSDGSYATSVTPVNKAGRRGTTQNFNFVYDTVAPEVRSEDIKLLLSGSSLTEITAIATDDAPSSTIDWNNADSNWVKLVDPKGKSLSGRVSNDKSKTLSLKLDVPLASNGTQDGLYKVILAPKDKAGNVPKGLEYEFVYDTKPPTLISESLSINGKSLILDTNAEDYPASVSSQGGVAIIAKFKDEGQGVDLTASTITVLDPSKQPISGTFQQNGIDTLQFTSGFLSTQGMYSVSIKAVGLDKANLGIKPSEIVSTTFLFETTKPTSALSSYGTKKTLKDESAPLKGTAIDKASGNTPASGVALVEIGGEGPNGALKWIVAEDESAENQQPWSQWKLDYLPNASGEYELKIRVTDEAGNSEIFDAITLNFSVSLSFTDKVFVWPNPVNISQGDVANFSFILNVPSASSAVVSLSIYEVSGDLIYRSDESNVRSGAGRLNDQIRWNGNNQSGEPVSSGIYIFRLEAFDGKSRTHKAGRFLVVRK